MTQPSEPQHVDANPTAKRQAHEADTCASAAAVDLVYENEVIDEKDAALLERHRRSSRNYANRRNRLARENGDVGDIRRDLHEARKRCVCGVGSCRP